MPYLDDETVRVFFAMMSSVMPAPRLPSHPDIEAERMRIRMAHPTYGKYLARRQ